MTPAIDVIFGKWTVSIIWALSLHGPTRFTTLRTLVGDISPKVLTQRLHHLIRNGIVSREFFDESPPRVEYQVTELGRTLTPVFDVIQEWTEEHIDEVYAARDHFDQ